MFNMDIGCKEYEVMLPRDNKAISGRDMKHYSDGVKIKITTLDNIVKSLGIENATLKIDCEGCEYEAFMCSDNETLRKFDEIMIEYHYGYKNIVEKLKKIGFKTRYTKPKYSYKPTCRKPTHVHRIHTYHPKIVDILFSIGHVTIFV